MSNADLLAKKPDYLQTLSLKCDPFTSASDSRFFYAGAALMQRLDLLIHLTQFGDSAILVSGPRGSGKTTLLSRYASQAKPQWRLCAINGDQFGEFPQLLADALATGEDGSEAQQVQRWASETDSSQLLVLLVDRAESLSSDDVEQLCNLATGPAGDRVRLILFVESAAQQALKQALDSTSLPGLVQVLEVPRLSEEETASYLMYRLAVAGYSGESPFTATEIRGICKAAEGRPAAINLLAHGALQEQQARSQSKRLKPAQDKRRPGAATWGPATLGIVLVAVYLGWDRLQPEEATTETEPVEILEESVPLGLPAPAQTALVPTPAAPEAVEPDRTAPQVRSIDPPIPAVEVRPADTPAISAAKPADSTGKQPATTAINAVGETVATQVDQPTADTTTPAKLSNQTTAAQPTPAEPPELPEATQPSPDAAESPKPALAADTPHRESWLLAQDSSRYSLQLLGSRNEQSIAEFIEGHGLDPALSAYYRGQFKGGDWYVLMYGVYADRDAALAGRSRLPASVRKAKPWPRTLDSVQQAIRESH